MDDRRSHGTSSAKNMSPRLEAAIQAADSILPGSPRENDTDRWQAIVSIGEFVETGPEPIWEFVARWGSNPLEDLRDAIATVLVEHLLEFHFDTLFARIEMAVRSSALFADMFLRAWKFGQAELPHNSARFDELQKEARNVIATTESTSAKYRTSQNTE